MKESISLICFAPVCCILCMLWSACLWTGLLRDDESWRMVCVSRGHSLAGHWPTRVQYWSSIATGMQIIATTKNTKIYQQIDQKYLIVGSITYAAAKCLIMKSILLIHSKFQQRKIEQGSVAFWWEVTKQ